ncbi:hypothetical protein P154DRAFT_517530 [Amniculicola lignicola CBS 123094]|uniref:Transcription factor TFIIIC complex subunit Tfc6 n=1 Tax=Amniculicola lignicola CBS 123094 TaxID=1392246 RepID=A0A6A5WZY3_9PLEO|nr:hypothetical protein P154DRAFT_517530 [Amniculicola lignicola CBS 123094]
MEDVSNELTPRRQSRHTKKVSYALYDPDVEEALRGSGSEVEDEVEKEFSPAPEELEDAELYDRNREVDDRESDSPPSIEEDVRDEDEGTFPKGPLTSRKRAKKAKVQEIGLGVAFVRAPGTQVHSRGIVEKPHNARAKEEGVGVRIGQQKRIEALFGPNHIEFKPVFQTRDTWEDQDALPSRQDGNLRVSYYVNKEAMEKEFMRVKESNIFTYFAKGQETALIDHEQAKKYLRTAGPEKLSMLGGNSQDPELLAMEKGRYIDITKRFEDDKHRRGWIFNLGAHIQETQWAPNEEGNTQFLAVAVKQINPDGYQHPPLAHPKAPAFTATKGFPASIQIWAFRSTDQGALDTIVPPQLKLVICTEWGAPKQFRWCPVPLADIEPLEGENTIYVGLLAGIWSDGRIRILDVSYQGDATETQYVKYSKAAFEATFSDAIPTTLNWLSASSIAVGTTSGALAIWNLLHKSAFPSPDSSLQSHNPRPWFYRTVIDNYILTINSGYPSRPNYVSISSTDGFSRMMDLRSATLDTVVGNKGRNFVTTQAWHEHTQSFLLPDEMYLLRNASVRRYYSNVYSGRMDSTITKVVSSPVHPGILIGSAEGLVMIGNPVMRVLNSKEDVWQLPWFSHEWRGPLKELPVLPKEVDLDGNDDMEDVHPTTLEPGNGTHRKTKSLDEARSTYDEPLACFREALVPKQVNLHIKSGRFPESDFEAKRLTTYEEASAITALAWNPNLKYGTWAVAGMGDGLMRVEDLGIDGPEDKEEDDEVNIVDPKNLEELGEIAVDGIQDG